jgi:glutathione synthase/RimK-type ligase-like ATP-grasp enzyme
MARGPGFPVVAKPDLGWCGYGVRKLSDSSDLEDYLSEFPSEETFVLQRYLPEPARRACSTCAPRTKRRAD